MSNTYRIFGAEMSPYSIKVRAYFRYKNIPHQWIARSAAVEEEYKKYARLPIVPAVATPEEEGLQDSTPIMEEIDRRFPTPSTHAEDPALAFLGVMIEEFGDEWGNKLMFHHRWWEEVDVKATARVLARNMMPDGDDETINNVENFIADRMSGRRDFVGSNEQTAPLIRGYFIQLLDVLEAHLASRPYLFGGRPGFGDFGLAAQLYEAYVDPTAGGIMRARYENVVRWCLNMLDPKDAAAFESYADLQATLDPLLDIVGNYFLPWSVANAQALEAGEDSFTVTLAGDQYVQPPQKYHAKSLKVLREKYAAVADKSALDPILEKTGCLPHLQG